MVQTVKLRNGNELELDEENPKPLFETIISDVFIPKYKETDDFNLSINIGIAEVNHLITEYKLKPTLKIDFLNELEDHLDKDIAELSGVAKIEILFLNMDDYVEDIQKLITMGLSKEELRDKMANMIAPLTLFEIGELFIFLGREAFLK